MAEMKVRSSTGPHHDRVPRAFSCGGDRVRSGLFSFGTNDLTQLGFGFPGRRRLHRSTFFSNIIFLSYLSYYTLLSQLLYELSTIPNSMHLFSF